jgi:hypothetical protein
MGKTGFVAIALVTLGLTLPAAAAGDSSEVNETLATATSTYRDKGYSPAGWEKFGALANATDVRLPLPLKAGKSYQIVAACEKKCTDLDLQLFDAEGKEVDWDAQDDDFPIVVANSKTAQVYTLRVVMSACKAGPCAYGAKAFVKN